MKEPACPDCGSELLYWENTGCGDPDDQEGYWCENCMYVMTFPPVLDDVK